MRQITHQTWAQGLQRGWSVAGGGPQVTAPHKAAGVRASACQPQGSADSQVQRDFGLQQFGNWTARLCRFGNLAHACGIAVRLDMRDQRGRDDLNAPGRLSIDTLEVVFTVTAPVPAPACRIDTAQSLHIPRTSSRIQPGWTALPCAKVLLGDVTEGGS